MRDSVRVRLLPMLFSVGLATICWAESDRVLSGRDLLKAMRGEDTEPSDSNGKKPEKEAQQKESASGRDAPITPVRVERVRTVDQQSGIRVVHFPGDVSLGRLTVQDVNARRRIKSFHNWVAGTKWEYLGEAQGDVAVPAGKRLGLTVHKRMGRRLSGLSNLKPDDLYMLSLSYTSANDRTMQRIAHLTGLRELSLRDAKIGSQGLGHITRLRSLEELCLPKYVSDAGLAEVCKLQSLKRLYFSGENRVSNRGLAYLANLPLLEELDLNSGKRLSDAGLVHLARLRSLRYVHLGGNFSDAGLAHIAKIASLRILNVNISRLTDAGLANLSTHQGLENLSMHWMEGITDAGLIHLKKMGSLKKLDVNHSRITDRGVATLAEFKSLEHLTLPNLGLTDKAVAQVAGLKMLKYLWVCCASNSPLTDESLSHIGKLSSLEGLNIGGSGFTDMGISDIGKLKNLRRLGLSWAPQVTDEGLAHLAGLKSLETLSLRGPNVSVSGLRRLDALSNLRTIQLTDIKQDDSGLDLGGLARLESLQLSLTGRPLRDEDLKTLGKLSKLKSLQINSRNTSNGIGDKGIEYLAGLDSLEFLNTTAGPSLTDDGLAHLAGMKRLWRLIIHGTGDITDKGLCHLETLKTLNSLHLCSQNAVSNKALERLRKELPNLVDLKVIP